MKISLLGPYPPPFGGISVHVQRLKERLDKRNIPCVVYNYSGWSNHETNIIGIRNRPWWLFKQLFQKTADILHCHGYSAMALIFLSILAMARKRKIVITSHGFLFPPARVPLLDRIAFWIGIKAGIHFIVAGAEMEERIPWARYKIGNSQKHLISSFIAPIVREEDFTAIPREVWDFVNNHSPLITANAYKIVFYNNHDLYGIDLCIELCQALKQSRPNTGLVFFLPEIGDHEYFLKMKRRLAEKDLQDNFLFVTQKVQLYPVIMNSDVFVRPTAVDWFGVSVAEAIYFKVPTVASDVCPRAKGTLTFRNRDVSEFIDKVKGILDNYERHKKRLDKIEIPDAFDSILMLYEQIDRM